MKKNSVSYIIFCFIALFSDKCFGQEHTGPLKYNAMVQQQNVPAKHSLNKKTSGSLPLPFFEDFTGYSPLPDSNKWADHEVYINNTMCVSPVSRGVATMDALNANGIPYDTLDNFAVHYCDSLTSMPIDLSGHNPADSIYLSFFYQPQGNGFYPLASDSLYLYMRKSYADWILVWSAEGSALKPFQQAMIPILDTNYLYDSFRFRFVNIASLNYSDAIWNIDYIRLNTGRNMYDTAVNDLAFTSDPSFLLNDYTFMPYHQFMANPNIERASQFTDSIRNNYNSPQAVAYGYTSKELTTNTPLYSTASLSNTVAAPLQSQQLSNTTYTNTIPLTGQYNKITFENKFYFQSLSSADPAENDTIVKEQVFDNYLAYDDGTAEQSYYLTQFSTLPAYLAIEFHLNQPDTLQGLAIYFGRQSPLPFSKFFSIIIYGSLNGINGGSSDNILLKEDNITPGYVDTINHFWVYSFSHPVPLPAGLFYAGTMQPAYGGADSLYFGLDVNRIGTNHAYYNVASIWSPSQVSGAIMIRPILGQPVAGTGLNDVKIQQEDWFLGPNPANDLIHLGYTSNAKAVYQITDIQGRKILSGDVNKSRNININALSPGMYFVTLYLDGMATTSKKLIKQ